jgi:outer membrane receptor for ferrienterochelin and colicin
MSFKLKIMNLNIYKSIKSPIIFYKKFIIIILFSCISFQLVYSQKQEPGDSLFDLSIENLMNLEVVTAGRFNQKAKLSPAFITVISKDQIIKSGCRNLNELLQIVPGFNVTINQFGLYEIKVRGLGNTNSSGVKLLLNGISLNNYVFGDATRVFDDMALDNVEKVEIIRGPGSSLYGSNAVLSVINIITDSDLHEDVFQNTIKYGSFNSFEWNTNYNDKIFKKIEFHTSINYLKTDGPELEIKRDRLYGNTYSLSPGFSDHSNSKLDIRFLLKYKNWKLNILMVDKNRGPFIGPSYALVERDKFKNRENYSMINLENTFDISQSFRIKPQIYYKRFFFSPDGQIYPPDFGFYDSTGTALDINADGIIDVFPNGMIATYELAENAVGFDILNEYQLNQNHYFTLGLSSEYIWLDILPTEANFNIIVPGAPYYLDGFESFDEGIVKPSERFSSSVYLQDSWHIFKAAYITPGVRFDYHNDFGSVLSPKLAFAHEINKLISYKLMYGHAYRAPGFGELARVNNTNIIGNPDLKPSSANTFEAGYQLNLPANIKFRMNAFYIHIYDRIVRKYQGDVPPGYAALMYENEGENKSIGIECQLEAIITSKISGFINYTYQDVKTLSDEDTWNKTALIPESLGNVIISYNPFKNIFLNYKVNYVSPRLREINDTRPDLEPYFLSSVKLTAINIFNHFNTSIGIYNLFDTKYYDPGHMVFIPDDYPKPGRNYYLSLTYNL